MIARKKVIKSLLNKYIITFFNFVNWIPSDKIEKILY